MDGGSVRVENEIEDAVVHLECAVCAGVGVGVGAVVVVGVTSGVVFVGVGVAKFARRNRRRCLNQRS